MKNITDFLISFTLVGRTINNQYKKKMKSATPGRYNRKKNENRGCKFVKI